MPLPEQAIERLVRKPETARGTYGQLLMFSGTLFFFAIIVWAGLVFGYRPYLEKQITEVQNQVRISNEKIPKDEQQALVRFYSQVANVRTLIANHILSTPSFDLLERVVHPNVAFTKASITVAQNQLVLSGTAKTVSDVVTQEKLFEVQPAVTSVTTNNVNATVGGYQFVMTVSLRPGVLREGLVLTRGGPAEPLVQ